MRHNGKFPNGMEITERNGKLPNVPEKYRNSWSSVEENLQRDVTSE